MKVASIRDLYPRASGLIRGWISDGTIVAASAETLSYAALDRIESGQTTERDALALLKARTADIHRKR